MISCTDVERMLHARAWPRGVDQRQACLTHLEACASCRAAAGPLGGDLATLADFSAPVGRGREPLIPATHLGTLVFSGETYRVDSAATVPGDGLATFSPSRTIAEAIATRSDASRTPGGAAGLAYEDARTLVDPLGATSGVVRTEVGLGAVGFGPETIPAGREELGTLRVAVDPASTRGQTTQAEPAPSGFDSHELLARMTTQPDSGRSKAGWPTVPGYELLAKLGEGGMGVVFKARHCRLHRLVALKMIRGRAGASAAQLERFRIEAEAVARLQHPNIVQIYEIGEVEGLPYFALELLEGGGLDARLAGRPMTGREAAELLDSLCAAIDAAHQARIIHRDLKPANIVLAADGTPKITDFGLAKKLEEDESSQTRTGDVMGSPSYMSPEQASGQVHRVGPTSDIYALGAILYELLTGRPPFRGPSVWDTVRQVIEAEPVAPSKLQPRVHRDLETIALKCLQKDAGRRYATAADLRADVRRFLDGAPIKARPVPFWVQGLKWARRKPALAASVVLAVTVVVGLIAGAIQYSRAADKERRDEVDRLVQTLSGCQEELSQGREQLAANPDVAWAHFKRAEQVLGELKAAQRRHPRAAELSRQASLGLGDARAAREAIRRRAEFNRSLVSFRALRDEALFLDTTFDGIQQGAQPHDPDAAGRKASEALDLFTRAGDDGSRTLKPLPDGLSAAERREVVSGAYELLLILADAEARAVPGSAEVTARSGRALRILDSAPGLDPKLAETRTYHRRRAALLADLGDEPGARREREASDAAVIRDAFDHYLYGLELFRQGDFEASIAEFQAARVGDPGQFWARSLLASACLRTGRAAVARVVLDECLASRPDLAWLYLLRGYATGQSGRASARPGTAAGGQVAFAAFDETSRAGVGDLEAAEEDFRRALDRLTAGDGDLRYTVHLDRGIVRLRAGRLGGAAEDFEAAIRVEPKRYHAYANLAGVRLHQGRLRPAIARLSEAVERADGPGGKAGVLRFRAVVREQRAVKLGLWADRCRSLAVAVQGIVPRPIGPGLGLAWSASALRRAQGDERRAAIGDYEAIPRDPADRPGSVASDRMARARLLLQDGRGAEARRVAEEALAADPGSAEAHRIRAGALFDQESYGEAIASFDACVAAGGGTADLFSMRGTAKMRTRDLGGAIDDFNRSLGLRPEQPRVLVARGWAHLGYGLPVGSPRLALDDFRAAILLDPSSAEAFCGRANAWALLGRPNEAVADANRALRIDSRNHLTLLRCARAYALASKAATSRARPEAGAPASPRALADYALTLTEMAIAAYPPDKRGAFYDQIILQDDALRLIRGRVRLGPLLRRDNPGR